MWIVCTQAAPLGLRRYEFRVGRHAVSQANGGAQRPCPAKPLHSILSEVVVVQHEPLAARQLSTLHEPDVILPRIRPEYPRDLFHRTERWLPPIGVLRCPSRRTAS